MTPQHVKVKITHIGMINGIEIGNSGKERTRVLGQRMYGETVNGDDGDLSMDGSVRYNRVSSAICSPKERVQLLSPKSTWQGMLRLGFQIPLVKLTCRESTLSKYSDLVTWISRYLRKRPSLWIEI